MAQWQYEADGGSYTVEEDALRTMVAEGKLDGETRLNRLDDDSLHRVDTAFPLEYRTATVRRRREEKEQSGVGKGGKSYAGLTMIVVLALSAGAAYGLYWYTSRVTCSRDDVQKLVQRVVKEKLLKVDKGTISIYGIATLGSLDSGGSKCSAEAEIKDTRSYFDGLHEVEYTAEQRGDSLYVTSRLTR